MCCIRLSRGIFWGRWMGALPAWLWRYIQIPSPADQVATSLQQLQQTFNLSMEVDTEEWFGTLNLKLPSNHGLLIGVRVFEDEKKKKLVIWDDKSIHFFSVKTEFNVSNTPQIVTIAIIRDVLQIKNSDEFLFLDKDGVLYCWEDVSSDSASAMEIDMDGDAPPCTRGPLLHGVLAMSSVNAGTQVCLLKEAGNELVLQLCSFVPASDISTAKIKSQCCVLVAAKSCQDRVGDCLLHILEHGSLSKKLRHLLCPSLSLEMCDIALVALANGHVLSVPLTGHDTTQKTHQILAAGSCVGALCTDSEHGSKRLHLVSSYLTTISAGNSKLEYETRPLCVSTEVACQAAPSCLLVSDTNHSWQASIDQSRVIMTPLPIHGITSAFKVKCGNLIVTTKHQTIYWLTLPVSSTNLSQVIPENPEILFQEIESISKQITDIESLISIENNFLKELSMLKRLPCIKDKFKLIIKIYDSSDSNYNFDIQIVNNSGICLTSKLWSIVNVITGKDVNLSHNQFLLTNFKNKHIIRIIAQFKIKKLTLPLALDCHLVSALSYNITSLVEIENKQGPWCTLPVGSITLDLSYFITPISTAEIVEEYREHVKEPEKNVPLFNLSLKNAGNLNEIAKILSKNCAHKGMGALRNSSCLAFKVGASKVVVKVRENAAILSSSANLLLLQVQTHLMDNLVKQGQFSSAPINMDPLIPLKAEGIKLALDLAEAEGGNKERQVIKLYESLRKQVTSRLPEPS